MTKPSCRLAANDIICGALWAKTTMLLIFCPRNAEAAKRFFRELLKSPNTVPNGSFTDKLGGYRGAHRELIPTIPHDTNQYANDLFEASHRATRKKGPPDETVPNGLDGTEILRSPQSGSQPRQLGPARHKRRQLSVFSHEFVQRIGGGNLHLKSEGVVTFEFLT
ncbi:MAG: hypothetical protein ACI9W2_001611 [Gammaproteobacteria bacterium]